MALVLCTGADSVLLQTRKLILEQAGHIVVVAVEQTDVMNACKQRSFDVAVIGHSDRPEATRSIALFVRRHCPSAKILELHLAHQRRTVDDADSWLEVLTNEPQELAERVTKLAEPDSWERMSA